MLAAIAAHRGCVGRLMRCFMRAVFFKIAPIALLVAASGCGTIYQHQNNNTGPYSGVRFDALAIGGSGDTGLAVVGGLDFPFSAVADTLLLPYDLTHSPQD
jgi:uncharacterized protein YceK